jgi:hypothetical protein
MWKVKASSLPQATVDIAGIPADLLISVYDDRVVILLSTNGKPGTLVHATVIYL